MSICLPSLDRLELATALLNIHTVTLCHAYCHPVPYTLLPSAMHTVTQCHAYHLFYLRSLTDSSWLPCFLTALQSKLCGCTVGLIFFFSFFVKQDIVWIVGSCLRSSVIEEPPAPDVAVFFRVICNLMHINICPSY
jgi:hypothetical protein